MANASLSIDHFALEVALSLWSVVVMAACLIRAHAHGVHNGIKSGDTDVPLYSASCVLGCY